MGAEAPGRAAQQAGAGRCRHATSSPAACKSAWRWTARRRRASTSSPQAIDDTLYDAFGQRQVSTIFTQLNQYRVILEVEPQYQLTPESLNKIYVKSTTGQMVPLSAFATVQIGTAPLTIVHQGQFPAVTLSFNLRARQIAGRGGGSHSDRATKEIGLPDTVVATFSGSAAEFRSSLKSEPFLILAAIVVIYIVLGVLYESYIHPHHDSVEPALGGRGRAAGADGLPATTSR